MARIALRIISALICGMMFSVCKSGKPAPPFPAETGFKYKIAYGAWINDMRNVEMLGEEWPYPVLDEQAEKDIISNIKLQSEAGFNVFTVWGLLATNEWPIDIASAVDKERSARVNRIIKATHDHGMKILPGLGVYSWGYQEIIRNDPEVAGDNPNAMCASKEASWEYVKKIIDYTFTVFPGFDGIHMESADLGRCSCEQCIKHSNIEYHVKINIKTADYIREKYPDKIIKATTCGFVVEPEHGYKTDSLYTKLSQHLDIFIVPHLTFRPEQSRPKWIEDFHCDFGSNSDLFIYPSQHRDRFKWFLPHPKATGISIKQNYEAGSRAMEYYMGPAINPSTEFNIVFGGKMMSNPEKTIEDIALETVSMLYAPRNKETGQKLSKIFFDAEEAYISNSNFFRNGDWWLCTLFFDGQWWGTEPTACYISTNERIFGIVYMEAEGRKAYREALEDILEKLDEIEDNVGKPEKIQRIRRCINNVIQDLNELGFEPL